MAGIGHRLGWVLFPLGGLLAAPPGSFTLHGSVIGEYMTEIGPSLESSRGLMIELAALAARRAHIPIAMAPEVLWTRAQEDAMQEPGGLLVVLARTPQRDPKWIWLSVMYTDKVYAFTLGDQPSWGSYDALARDHPRVGAKLGSASESILRGRGVRVDAVLGMTANFRKLLLGRIDVLCLQGMEVHSALRPLMDDPAFRDRVPRFRKTAMAELPLWMVVSPRTPQEDVRRLRLALEDCKRSPGYRATVQRYEARLNAIMGR
nr:hypothetical protein [uncultured Holophaga sp.]